MPTAEAIIVRETIGLVKQCTALDDDLHDMIKVDVCRTVLRLGGQTLQEAQEELMWGHPKHGRAQKSSPIIF